jgi:hypothetical protein
MGFLIKIGVSISSFLIYFIEFGLLRMEMKVRSGVQVICVAKMCFHLNDRPQTCNTNLAPCIQ